MTVASNYNRDDHVGDGATIEWDYNFKIFDKNDLVVIYTDKDDVDFTLTVDTDYTVSEVGNPNGGKVKLKSGGVLTSDTLTAQENLTILRVIPVTQKIDLRNQRTFFGETHEEAFDRAVMVLQQHDETIGRAAVLPDSVSADDVDPTLPKPVAGKTIGWSSDKKSLENKTGLPDAAPAGDNEYDQISWDASAGDYRKFPDYRATKADLKAVDPTAYGLVSGDVIRVGGDATVGDGKGGQFWWDPTDRSTDVTNDSNEVFVVAPNSDPTGANGAFVRAPDPDGTFSVDDLSALRSLPLGAVDTVRMQYRSTVRDEGGGLFSWDGSDRSSDVAADELNAGEGDGGSVVAPLADKTGASGAWIRIEDENKTTGTRYGTVGDGATDDTAALQAALDAADSRDGHVYVPDGTHLIGAITVPLDVILELSPKAVLKPTSAFSGDLITLKNNARIEGGLIDCTGQTFTGDIIVPDPTPNVTGNTKRLVRGARNIAMKGDTTGRVLVLEALQDGESVYKDHYENVKCEGFDVFIRMAADNPGAGQEGYVNSNVFTACWCNNSVKALEQTLGAGGAGDMTANVFTNCGVQHGADTQKGLIIGGLYQSFINQQIWDFPASGKNKVEFDSNTIGNHVEGFLGDGDVSNGGTDNTIINYRRGWMPAKVNHTTFDWDPGSISGGDVVTTTIALGIGNIGSSFAVVQPNTDLHDLLALTCRFEQTAGQLLVQLAHSRSGGGAIDPGNTTFHVYVFTWGTADS